MGKYEQGVRKKGVEGREELQMKEGMQKKAKELGKMEELKVTGGGTRRQSVS